MKAAFNIKPIVIGVTIVYSILLLISILNHEMWRDELQPWDVVCHSDGLDEMIWNKRTEAHPALYYIIMYIATFISKDPLMLQMMNWVVSTTSIFLIMRYAPFKLFQNVLLAFSYVMFFEYGVIARSHAYEVLGLLSALVLFKNRLQSPWKLAIALIFMANMNIYGGILASTLLLYWLLDDLPQWNAQLKVKMIISLGIGISILDSYLQTIAWGYFNSEMTGTASSKDLAWFIDALGTYFNAFITIPNPFNFQFWNTQLANGFTSIISNSIKIIGFIMSVAAIILGLKKNKHLLIAIVIGSVVTWTLVSLIFYGGTRHHLHFFLLFFMGLWIMKNEGFSIPRLPLIFFNLCLLSQFGSNVYASYMDYNYTFSNIEKLGQKLSNPVYHDCKFVGYQDFSTSPISRWIDKELYFPQLDSSLKFTFWGGRRSEELSQDSLFLSIDKFYQTAGSSVVVVANFGANLQHGRFIGEHISLPSGRKMQYIDKVEGAMVLDENYYLYIIQKDD